MTIEVDTPADFSFIETMRAHGWRQLLPFGWDADSATLQRVERLAAGRVVLLRLREAAESVTVDAGEPVMVDDGEIVSSVRRMLQLDLPMDAFHAFCAENPKLIHVPGLRQGRLLCSPTVWEDVVKVILTTNTTWVQTKAMVQRIVDAYGSPLRADVTRHAFPTPQQIAEVPLGEFSAVARLGYRNASVHSLATSVAAGEMDLESLRDSSLPVAQLWSKLLALRGVGPYAASCLMIYLGRYERVNVDSWARMMVGKELDRAVTDKEVHEFFEPFGQWRALAYHFYPWRVEAPAY